MIESAPPPVWIYLAFVLAAMTALLVVGLRWKIEAVARVQAPAHSLLAVSALLIADDRIEHWMLSASYSAIHGDIKTVLRVAWWLAAAWLAIRLVEALVWRRMRERGQPAPKLLVQVVAALILIAAVFGVLSFVFGQPVTGLLATSGVVAIVVGLALQNTLSDLFSGVALNLEHPYRVGDWVRIDGHTLGVVVEVNWRATRLRTREGNELVLPNSKLAKSEILNFHYPAKRYRASHFVRLPYALSPERAKTILRSAALRSKHVLTEPGPQVRLKSFAEFGVEYELQFWVGDYEVDQDACDQVGVNVWHALQGAGVAVPFKQMVVHATRGEPKPPEVGPLALIRRASIFAPLSEAERAALAAALERLAIVEGTEVVRQGEAGDSLYLVADGLLFVGIAFDERGRHVVARLGPGEMFGEMSLLTGEPRSASVVAASDCTVYRLVKSALAPILAANPMIAGRFAEILAERKLADDEFKRSLPDTARRAELRLQGDAIVQRILSFFGLTKP